MQLYNQRQTTNIFFFLRRFIENVKKTMKKLDILFKRKSNGNKTPNAQNVALYLRTLVNYEEGDSITQIKLYKLVYYA
jgi:hypothetical protein